MSSPALSLSFSGVTTRPYFYIHRIYWDSLRTEDKGSLDARIYLPDNLHCIVRDESEAALLLQFKFSAFFFHHIGYMELHIFFTPMFTQRDAVVCRLIYTYNIGYSGLVRGEARKIMSRLHSGFSRLRSTRAITLPTHCRHDNGPEGLVYLESTLSGIGAIPLMRQPSASVASMSLAIDFFFSGTGVAELLANCRRYIAWHIYFELASIELRYWFGFVIEHWSRESMHDGNASQRVHNSLLIFYKSSHSFIH